jgi:hypothetical protein
MGLLQSVGQAIRAGPPRDGPERASRAAFRTPSVATSCRSLFIYSAYRSKTRCFLLLMSGRRPPQFR